MKRALISVLALLAIIATLGAGTFAYFDSEQTKASSAFTGGTIDLKLGANDANGVSNTWSFDKMQPGDVVDQWLKLHNDGTVDAKSVLIKFDCTGNLMDEIQVLSFQDNLDVGLNREPASLFAGQLGGSDSKISVGDLCRYNGGYIGSTGTPEMTPPFLGVQGNGALHLRLQYMNTETSQAQGQNGSFTLTLKATQNPAIPPGSMGEGLVFFPANFVPTDY